MFAIKKLKPNLYSKSWAAFLLLLPFLILFITFNILPIIFSFYLSFHRWNPIIGLSSMRFVGVENYIYALGDPELYQAIFNTVKISIYSGIPQHLLAIPLAYILLFLLKRGTGFLKAAIFMPYITSSVAISVIVVNLFASTGIVNDVIGHILSFFNLSAVMAKMPIDFMGVALIKTVISSQVVWKFTGINMVIYMTGMLSIDKSLYEAAEIDGASRYQRFRYITLPLLKPYILFGTVMTLIGNMQLFEEPMMLTKGSGGIDNSGMTVAMHIYKTGWEYNQMGISSAVSWILFILIIILSLITFKLFGKNALTKVE